MEIAGIYLTPKDLAALIGLAVLLGILLEWAVSLESQEVDEFARQGKYGPPDREEPLG